MMPIIFKYTIKILLIILTKLFTIFYQFLLISFFLSLLPSNTYLFLSTIFNFVYQYNTIILPNIIIFFYSIKNYFSQSSTILPQILPTILFIRLSSLPRTFAIPIYLASNNKPTPPCFVIPSFTPVSRFHELKPNYIHRPRFSVARIRQRGRLHSAINASANKTAGNYLQRFK